MEGSDNPDGKLKFAAKNWRDYSTEDSIFNLEVLNYTGRITKDILK